MSKRKSKRARIVGSHYSSSVTVTRAELDEHVKQRRARMEVLFRLGSDHDAYQIISSPTARLAHLVSSMVKWSNYQGIRVLCGADLVPEWMDENHTAGKELCFACLEAFQANQTVAESFGWWRWG